MSKHNLELLIEAAHPLEPLLGELVFVGGSTTALLITDKGAADVRPTYDVDAIAEITSYAAMQNFRNDCAKLALLRTRVKELKAQQWGINCVDFQSPLVFIGLVHVASSRRDPKWSQAIERIQSRGLSRRVGHFLQCPTLHLAGDAFRQIFYEQNSLRNFEIRQALARMVSQFLFVGH
jgi:hypothetical protein